MRFEYVGEKRSSGRSGHKCGHHALQHQPVEALVPLVRGQHPQPLCIQQSADLVARLLDVPQGFPGGLGDNEVAPVAAVVRD